MKFLIAIHSIHLVQKRYRLSVYNRAAICPVNAPFRGHGSNASFDRCEIAAFRLLERIIRYCNIVSISDVIPDGKCEACLAFLVHQLLGRADWLPCSILCQAPRLEGCLLDWVDKIAKKRNTNQRDVSGESVQQGMLKLLEGADVEVPVGASSKNAMVPMVTVNTRNILFICGGAFPDLDSIIKERLNQESSMGFKAALKDQYDEDENILQKVTVEDIRTFGMIPEFIGRLPILFSLEALTEDMLVRILKEPRNAILKQYQKLLEMDEVKLEFEDEALHAIAKKAKEKKVGARALRAIIEEFMLDIMYEIPKDDNIGKVIITKEYIEKTGGPVIMMRGCPELEEKSVI